MKLDWNKFSPENNKDEESWTPPLREREMEQVSKRLAVSSRIHPSYLLMAYGYLTEKRGIDPSEIKSISDLIYKAVCDYINTMQEPEEGIPDPDISLSFLVEQGWISVDNKENRAAFTKIRHVKGRLEQKVMQGEASLKEQYEYWRDRDPQKAEEVMEEMTKQVITGIDQEKQESSWKSKEENNSEETVVSDNRSGYEQQEGSSDNKEEIAILDYLDDMEAEEEN